MGERTILNLMKLAFLTILFLLCFSQMFSQETVWDFLRGRVVDAVNLPVEKARVKIVSDSGLTSFCETDAEGQFACEANFNEGFALVVEAGDFSTLRQEFVKRQDFSPGGVFTLAPKSLRETVQVTANRTETR